MESRKVPISTTRKKSTLKVLEQIFFNAVGTSQKKDNPSAKSLNYEHQSKRSYGVPGPLKKGKESHNILTLNHTRFNH